MIITRLSSNVNLCARVSAVESTSRAINKPPESKPVSNMSRCIISMIYLALQLSKSGMKRRFKGTSKVTYGLRGTGGFNGGMSTSARHKETENEKMVGLPIPNISVQISASDLQSSLSRDYDQGNAKSIMASNRQQRRAVTERRRGLGGGRLSVYCIIEYGILRKPKSMRCKTCRPNHASAL